MPERDDYFAVIQYMDGGERRETRITNLTEQEVEEQIVLLYTSRRPMLLSGKLINYPCISEIHIFMAIGKFKEGVMRAVIELKDIRQMIAEEDGRHFKDVTADLFNSAQDAATKCSPPTTQHTIQPPPPIRPQEPISATRIFVVHGWDEAMEASVARTIERLGLEPIILHEQTDRGRTVVEKFTQCSDVGFAVVLLSPDDFAYPKILGQEKGKFRARQNVILELGYFVGKLGRDKVMVLHKDAENFDMPTDFAGVVYTPFDPSGQWQLKLVKELRASGYNVDANKLIC